MTDESNTTAGAPESPGRRTVWQRGRRAVIVYVVVPYLAICVLLAVFQRSLIYVPTRSVPLNPEDAGRAADLAETIHVTTHDDLQLNGWHIRPPGTEPGHEPRWLVLYFHGNGGNRQLRADDCLDFAEAGLDVFLFDYRGYGDSPGSPSESNIARDARAIWRFATEQRSVPPSRILLYGESLGGGVAVRLASELCTEGTPPAGLILSSTFSSLSDAAANRFPWLPVRWLLIDRYPSIDRIPRITCPIVVVHGEEDRIVPIALGRRLFSAAPDRSANGIAKRFVAYPGRAHNDLSKSEFTDAVRTLLDELPVDADDTSPVAPQ